MFILDNGMNYFKVKEHISIDQEKDIKGILVKVVKMDKEYIGT